MPAQSKSSAKVVALAKEIRQYCSDHADPKQALKWSRYFKEGYDAWGILDKDDPFWNEKMRAWLEGNRGLGLRGFLELGAVLFQSGKYEEGSLAIRFVKGQRDALDAKTLPLLARWFAAGIANWAHTDVLCGEVLGPLLESGQIELAALSGWRSAEFKFQRRAVPVAMLALLKGDANIGALLEFVRPLMEDSERVVHQGVGWFLREAWKKEPRLVEKFLYEWKDTAPRLIFQYATEKMKPEAKARFRRGK